MEEISESLDSDLQWVLITDKEISAHLDVGAPDSSHPLASQGRAESVDFVFGDEVLSVEPTADLEVYKAVNDDGSIIWDVGVVTSQTPELASSGFAVPPSSAWKYYNSGTGKVETGTWKRQWWTTINKANNYTANGATRDYYRICGKVQASVLTDKVNGNVSGFDQAWIEFDRNSDWPSSTASTEFEEQLPTDSIDGKANQTISVGFKTGLSVTLGKAPLTVSGSYESTYTGTLSSALESWHPVQRSEAGSGGVMWCYYKVNTDGKAVEFNGSKTMTARSSIHTGSYATPGTWTIKTGQRDRAHGTSCPNQ
ncbi:hypothetical protein [Demequina sp.]|uniref:hypothetical protein n=1 Tax=Demequina sp. TaxID=2050685 RepID=UPI003A85BEB5